MKKNCWEYKKCERGPNGSKVDLLGICPAAINKESNGVNNGSNGGRICWAIAGTLCEGRLQGTFALNRENCIFCDFYSLVRNEEGEEFEALAPDQKNIFKKELKSSIHG